MLERLGAFASIGLGLGLAMAFVQGAVAQQNPVTTIDIALEPDATMVQHAMAISYVANFVSDAAGKRFNPHVTIGVGAEKHLTAMLAEPFPSFTFSPAGASVYQLGAFGTARKELKALTLTP